MIIGDKLGELSNNLAIIKVVVEEGGTPKDREIVKSTLIETKDTIEAILKEMEINIFDN